MTPAWFVLASTIWAAGSGADLRTTDIGLSRPGVYEANPLYERSPSDARLYLEGAAISVGVWCGARHLWKHGHKGAAVTILVAGGLTRGALAQRNRGIGAK